MLKKILAAVCCMSAMAFSVTAQSKHHVINVGDFTEVKVVSNINVDYVASTDSAGMICFTADDDAVVNLIEASLKKGRLRIAVKNDENKSVTGVDLPTLRIYSSFLQKVENEGDSTVRVLTSTPVPNFSARLIGNGALVVREVKATSVDCSLLTGHGRMAVYGSCTDARFNLAGTGIIQADGLQAVNANCFATGTGEIGVNAQKIKISGAGSGTIYYTGNPAITKSLAIGIKVLPME